MHPTGDNSDTVETQTAAGAASPVQSRAKVARTENGHSEVPPPKPIPEEEKLVKQITTPLVSNLLVKKLSDRATIPRRGSAKAAGYDLSSAEEKVVPARGRVLVQTDISIAIPPGTYARVAPRSGLGLNHGIDVGAGVVDEDYRGPVGVLLFNLSDTDFTVKAGDRIAQLILERILTPDVLEVKELDGTARGSGGFGSTGVAVEEEALGKEDNSKK